MNNRMLHKAVRNWLDESNLAYLCAREKHFAFMLDAAGRVGFFDATIDVEEGTLQLNFTFPVCAHEDEMLDTRFALDAINGALNVGLVRRIDVLSNIVWSAGVRIDDEESASEIIERLARCGRSVIEGYTEYLADLLMNGRDSAPELPCVQTEPTDGLPLLTNDELLDQIRRQAALSEADDEAEEDDEDLPDVFVRCRISETQSKPDPAYRCYRKYLSVFNSAASGNGGNRLIWHRWLSSRMDKARLELHTAPDSQTLLAILPIRPLGEERVRVQKLLDSMNGELEYGFMLLMDKSGLICHRLKVREDGGPVLKHVFPAQASQKLLSECSDAILRAMLDRNADHELLVRLCHEGIEEMNARCRAEGVRQIML